MESSLTRCRNHPPLQAREHLLSLAAQYDNMCNWYIDCLTLLRQLRAEGLVLLGHHSHIMREFMSHKAAEKCRLCLILFLAPAKSRHGRRYTMGSAINDF